jgi:hypothetical protein
MQIRPALAWVATIAICCIAGSAGADDELAGHDWLRGKNTEQQAVLLGHQVYQLNARTQILGLEGQVMSLDDLVWVPELESLDQVPRIPTLWVEYDATRVGDRLILNWVKLTLDQEGLDLTRMNEVDRYGRLPASAR